jgi:hypothetical protein
MYFLSKSFKGLPWTWKMEKARCREKSCLYLPYISARVCADGFHFMKYVSAKYGLETTVLRILIFVWGISKFYENTCISYWIATN